MAVPRLRWFARHDLPTMAERLGHDCQPVLDPLVIDRGVDKWRKGGRKLVDMVAHYEVTEQENLHTADVDVIATLDVLAAAHPDLADQPLDLVHGWQAVKHREWAEGFNTWRERKGFDGPGADLGWPLPLAQQFAPARA